MVTFSSLVYDEANHRMICCACAEWVDLDDLYVDEDGQKWDLCKPCEEREA